MTTDPGYLPVLDSREEYVDFLEGYALPTHDEIEERRPTRKLVKTYMLETVGQGHDQPVVDVLAALSERAALGRVDDTMFRVHERTDPARVVGLLELMDDRHPVFHTTLGVKDSDPWVRGAIDQSPWLDRLWLSSHILFELWQYVQRTAPSHRYVRLGFEHEAWYETVADDPSSEAIEAESESEGDDAFDDDSSRGPVERRRSRVQLTERLGVLERKLPDLVRLYDPLHSLVQLQMPSGGRGGHLLHYDGKATNRGESFVEHRATVAMVLDLYRRVTEHAESHLWMESADAGLDGYRVKGAPLLIRFSKPLSAPTFDRFVQLGLQRKTSRFRIGGYLRRRGPTKVHLTAIDRHLWQPFLLEATTQQLLAVLPRGTCGNTVHRMVTNVQRYLDPDVEVWLGSEPYQDAVASSFGAAA